MIQNWETGKKEVGTERQNPSYETQSGKRWAVVEKKKVEKNGPGWAAEARAWKSRVTTVLDEMAGICP